MKKKNKKRTTGYEGVRDYHHLGEITHQSGRGAHPHLKDKLANRKSKQSQREKQKLKEWL